MKKSIARKTGKQAARVTLFSRFFVFELHKWKKSLQRDKIAQLQGERGEHSTYTINLMHP
jgi:hypothetical protein